MKVMQRIESGGKTVVLKLEGELTDRNRRAFTWRAGAVLHRNPHIVRIIVNMQGVSRLEPKAKAAIGRTHRFFTKREVDMHFVATSLRMYAQLPGVAIVHASEEAALKMN